MSHPFGDLLTQHLHRKHGLSQSKLAAGILQSPSIVTEMCQGKRLNGPQARERVVAITAWLHQQGALDDLNEVNALLSAAGMSALNDNTSVDAVLVQSLRPSFDSHTDSWTAKQQPKPNNLPLPATPLVGREVDVMAVLKLLKRDDVRLITLVGPPGVGKTRLAIEVARMACDSFAEGAIFVELAPISDAEFVASAIAHACGLKDALGQSLIEDLRQHLRDKHLLLVVDNFEHVLSAAPLISQVLSTAPRLKVLVTGREPSQLSGEHRYNVLPLVLPDLNGHDKVSQVAESPAVQVFVQRAKAAMPTFRLSEGNASTVAEICQRLDGLPLALELAAPRVTLLTLHELLARLDRQLAVLTMGAQDLPPRQRTLRATIDWSYHLLSGSEQALLRHLAVFAGGCTLEAIEAVCQPGETSQSAVMDDVATLMSKNLLSRVEGANNQSRYQMLEMIREYATEKLTASGEADQRRLRHAEYYLAYADALQVHDWWMVEPGSVEQVEPELDNFHAAIAWSQTTPDYIEIGLRLIPALATMHWRQGSSDKEWRWIKRTLAQLKGAGLPQSWAMAAGEAATVLALLGDYATAQAFFEESLSLFRELGDTIGSARMLERKGWLARERAGTDGAQAHAWLEESFELYRANGHSEMCAWVLCTDGELAIKEENAAQATHMLEQALAIFESHGNQYGKAYSLSHLGHAAQLTGDYARATWLHEQSLMPFKEAQALGGLASAAHGLGETALSQRDAMRTHEQLVKSLVLFRRLGDRMGISWCLAGLAGAAALDESLERGARLWGAGEGLRQRIGCRIAPASRLNRERTVSLLRERLGNARFEAEQTLSSMMPPEQAIEYAIYTARTNIQY